MKSQFMVRLLHIAVPVVLLSGALCAHAADKRVAVIDRASSSIVAFYASPSGDDDWGDDLLGLDVIGVNEYDIIDVEDGTPTCFYDFKAVLRNGRTATTFHLNVCRAETWTVTN